MRHGRSYPDSQAFVSGDTGARADDHLDGDTLADRASADRTSTNGDARRTMQSTLRARRALQSILQRLDLGRLLHQRLRMLRRGSAKPDTPAVTHAGDM